MVLKNRYISTIILGLLLTTGIFAQTGQTLFLMNLPQSSELNPAFRPSSRVYVSLPVISGINFSMGNNFFNFSDVFTINPENDSIITPFHPDADIEDFMKKIKNTNALEVQTKVPLLGLGFAFGKKNFISLDINTRANGYVAFPGDMLRLAIEGNEQFVGSTIDLTPLNLKMNVYNEIGVGFSRDITDKLRVGVKGKVLVGIATASTKIRELGIDVTEDYSHIINADMDVMLSAPVAFATTGDQIDSVYNIDYSMESASEVINYLFKSGNMGLGIDIGAEYSLTNRINLSAAITDLGYIKWKRDASMVSMKGQFDFSGLDVSDVISGEMTMDSLGGILLDSIITSMDTKISSEPFTTSLPFNVNLGGSFDVTNFFSVGVLSSTRFVGKQVKEAVTLSANVSLKTLLSASVAYTMANNSYRNLGIGLAMRLGYGQFYVVTDHVPLSYNQIITNSDENPNGIKVPSNWNLFNLRMGMNLTFGNRPKD